jgi:hypothetical protein
MYLLQRAVGARHVCAQRCEQVYKNTAWRRWRHPMQALYIEIQNAAKVIRH